MANGQGPRRGLGIAFQGRAETPDYLFTQAQNQAQRRRKAQGELQQERAQERQDAMEDYEGLEGDIHPVWNPVKNQIKEEFWSNVKQLRRQKPQNYRNTDKYQKYLRDAKSALGQLREKTKEWRNIRNILQNNENAYFNPEITRAMKTGDLQKLQQATGNELGLWGESLTFLEDTGKMAADAAEQAGGMDAVLTKVREANKGQIERVTYSKLPNEFQNQLEAYWENPNTKKALQAQGVESKDEWLEEGTKLVKQRAQEIDMVRDPEAKGDGGGGGRGGEDKTLFGGMQTQLERIQGDVYEQISTGKVTPDDFQNLYSQSTQMRPTEIEGTDLAFEYQGVGENSTKTTKFRNLYSDRVIDEDKQQVAQVGDKKYGRVGATSDQVPGRVQDIKTVMGYYDDKSNLNIVSKKDLQENPELINEVQAIARSEIRPIEPNKKKHPDLYENYKRLKGEGESGVYYEFMPLRQRGVSEEFDRGYYRANQIFSDQPTINPQDQMGGNRRYDAPEQRQRQEQKETERVPEGEEGGSESPNESLNWESVK